MSIFLYKFTAGVKNVIKSVELVRNIKRGGRRWNLEEVGKPNRKGRGKEKGGDRKYMPWLGL